MENLKVNCYSGHIYAEEPRSFQWQDATYEVSEVIRAWQEPGKRLFLVLTGDNKSFQLCYNETQKVWTIAMGIHRG
ncbi:hypothetical protein ACFLW8_00465 [Chloroflexota bacterium]